MQGRSGSSRCSDRAPPVHILQVRRGYQIELLRAALLRFFGDLDDAAFERALPVLEWLEYDDGDVLFEEGAAGDEVYFLVSGRLRATRREGRDGGDTQRVISEFSRGEAVGEIALLTGEPRSATVTAVRASVAVRLSRAGFDTLVAEFPQIALRFARLVVERLRRSNRVQSADRTRGMGRDLASTNIAIMAISAGIDAADFAAKLAASLATHGRTRIVTSADIRGEPSNAQDDTPAAESDLALRLRLDELEAHHRFMLLVVEPDDVPWLRRCLSQADEVMLIADAADQPALHPLERDYLSHETAASRARRRLVLLHDPPLPGPASGPRDTAAWLDPREIDSHVHIRRGSAADIARLARIVSGRAIGLVLSGGGARGYAHLGVYRALVERGIDVDYVGGTSMGAVVASLVALEVAPEEAVTRFRPVSDGGLLSDYHLLPMLSLVKGRRLAAFMSRTLSTGDGRELDIADTWKTFFCVASSFSHAKEVVLRRGPLARLLRASLSIPIYLPPVFQDKEVLVDGAMFNNFPTDIMAAHGIGCLIGVDLRVEPFGLASSDIPPGAWDVLRRFVMRRGASDPPGFPSLKGMLFRAPTLASSAKQVEAAKLADVLIRPDLSAVGLLEWRAIDRAVEIGYRSAAAELDRIAECRPDLWRTLLPAADVAAGPGDESPPKAATSIAAS